MSQVLTPTEVAAAEAAGTLQQSPRLARLAAVSTVYSGNRALVSVERGGLRFQTTLWLTRMTPEGAGALRDALCSRTLLVQAPMFEVGGNTSLAHLMVMRDGTLTSINAEIEERKSS